MNDKQEISNKNNKTECVQIRVHCVNEDVSYDNRYYPCNINQQDFNRILKLMQDFFYF